MSHPSSVIGFFPGQGSQQVGMFKELYDEFKLVREIFEEASDATGIHIKKLCFEGPEEALTLTENTQPCLLTVSVASFKLCESEWDFKPAITAGHSLGEYSALVASGAFSLSSAAQWVQARGKAMQEAVPPGQGGMIAILKLEDEKILDLCQKAQHQAEKNRESSPLRSDFWEVDCLLSPANSNAPGQTVLAGSQDAIDEAIHIIRNDPEFKGSKAIPLPVSAPFHCALMKPAREKMEKLFSKVSPTPPLKLTIPYLPNRTAQINRDPTLIFQYLIDQIDHEVRWKETIQTLLQEGYERGCEFGPGKVLQGLNQRIAKNENKHLEMQGVQTLEDLKTFGKWIEGR